MKLHAPQTAKTISYDLSDNSDLMRSTMARPPRIVAYAHCPSDFEAKLWRRAETVDIAVKLCLIGNSDAGTRCTA